MTVVKTVRTAIMRRLREISIKKSRWEPKTYHIYGMKQALIMTRFNIMFVKQEGSFEFYLKNVVRHAH